MRPKPQMWIITDQKQIIKDKQKKNWPVPIKQILTGEDELWFWFPFFPAYAQFLSVFPPGSIGFPQQSAGPLFDLQPNWSRAQVASPAH